VHEYILLPLISSNLPLSSTIQSSDVNVGDQPGDVNAVDQLRDVNVGDQPRDVNVGNQPGDVNAGDIQGNVDEISRNDDVCHGNEIRIDSSTNAINATRSSINTASNIIVAELSAAKQKLMLLDTAAERRLLLLSQVKTVNEKCYC
nr:hypothetical protein [Tanacetum cinerariifolium]